MKNKDARVRIQQQKYKIQKKMQTQIFENTKYKKYKYQIQKNMKTKKYKVKNKQK